MKKITLLVLLGGLLTLNYAKADDTYMCSVVKFIPDTDDEVNSLTAPKAVVVTVGEKSISLDKYSFKIVQPKQVGLNLKTLAGYSYFNNRRIYRVTNKANDTVFVSQPYNLDDGEVIPQDRIEYSKCSLVNGANISGQ